MSSTIKNKLYDLEQTPPPAAWNKIAAELDASLLDLQFPSKLYDTELNAPAGVWNKIAAELDSDLAAPPQKTRTIPWFRYAAAAVVIGLLAWGGFQLLSGNKTETSLAKEEIKKHPETSTADDNTKTVPITNDLPTETEIVRTEEERNDQALEASKKTFAKLDLPANSNKLRDIASAFSFATNAESTGDDDFDIVDRNVEDINSRYIVLMTPDGHFVRMAKKLSDMVCCVSGEEMDKKCVDQMSLWKQQLACSPTGHSAGTFLDVINLLKSLED